MKIELETHELLALQRNAEIDNLKQQLEFLRQDNANILRDHAQVHQELNQTRTEKHQLEGQVASRHRANGFNMSKLSQLFRTYSNGQGKINAIKMVRIAFQCELKEAKDIVEGNY